eukprot:CAMPEP_0119033806 /NCGR_PEP_ID=MMETSP1177-20130426/873_1 /TAXON_ID=2985 /ORGANISM="Ochromonas sp, Strain CCMP1899" /LENGTH=348 /DNA_ID=CAMNT_0006990845 /DNA_START=48 /DNA_END=1090 /DNA_ORIENTATION=-
MQGNFAPPPPPPPPAMGGVDEGSIRRYLSDHKWPKGLVIALMKSLAITPARFFICDDSGSMMSSDGHRVIQVNQDNHKVVTCTRWAELTETLKFHINLANRAQAPTEFRLLNGAAAISVGSDMETDTVGVPTMMGLLDASPGGGTPLCFHVNEVMKQIIEIAPQLKAAGKKAALVICTDGEASDGDIASVLRQLHALPVWVVIRLCTDQDAIVDYWNNIDNQIELNMDVIDDPIGEAKEIDRLNNWLTYGEPLHRLREFGVTAKEIDMIDEVTLSAEQMRNLCAFIFGVDGQSMPHPEVDFHAFANALSDLNDREPMVWNPMTGSLTKWINMKKLAATYNRRGGGGGG